MISVSVRINFSIRFVDCPSPSSVNSTSNLPTMAVQSKCFYSGHRSTGGSFLIRKKNKRPISSSDFESQHSTTSGIVCNLTLSQTARITEPFNHSLIAWVVGRKISSRYLAGRLHRYLRLTGDLTVTELGLGYFVLRFSESSDYKEALEERPWPIPNLCISVFPWIPNFKPSEASISSVDVWIRLHELCMEYYDKDVLQGVAGTIGGRLVKIDPITERLEKCMFARICVRINLYNPLPSFIHIDKIRQEIEYEGLDSLCPVCRHVIVGDLRHDCLSNPSGSSGFNNHHHRAPSFQAIGSSSKQLQAPFEPSAWGSRFQVLEKESFLDLNDLTSLRMGEGEKTATNFSKLAQKKYQSPGLIAKPVETQKEKCGVYVPTLPNLPKVEVPQSHPPMLISSNPVTQKEKCGFCVQTLPNLSKVDVPQSHPSMSISSNPVTQKEKGGSSFKTLPNLFQSMALRDDPKSIPSYPEAASTMSTKTLELQQNSLIQSMALHDPHVSISSSPKAAPELKRNKLIQSMALSPSVVEDQFRAAKTSTPTILAVHSNQPLLSSPSSIPSLQPSLVSEVSLKFYSAGIQCSTKKKCIINTPFKETSVDNRPIVYAIDPQIKSLAIALSEVPTMVSNHSQYVISFVPTLRGGNERGAGSESVSMSASCPEKMLCWNFRGTATVNLIRALKDLIQVHEPSIVLIFGSNISGAAADQVVQELAFCGSYCRKPNGYNGGVWLLLSRQDVQTEVNSYNSQQVSASVHFHSETNKPTLGLFDALYRYRNLYFDKLDG